SLLILMLSVWAIPSYAIGPSEIQFNEMKFFKHSEKMQNNIISAQYAPLDKNSPASITIMHVLGKPDPGKLAKGLKTKKSIEVVEIDNLKEDQSDLLVSFIKFDMPHLKVENNLCRIKRAADKTGSVVFQYID